MRHVVKNVLVAVTVCLCLAISPFTVYADELGDVSGFWIMSLRHLR